MDKLLISEAKLKERAVKAFAYEYLDGLSHQEALDKATKVMEMLYGEMWMYMRKSSDGLEYAAIAEQEQKLEEIKALYEQKHNIIKRGLL